MEEDTRTEPRQFEIFAHDPDKKPGQPGDKPAAGDKPQPAPQDTPQALEKK